MLFRHPSTGPLAKLDVWTSLLFSLVEMTMVVVATSVVGTVPVVESVSVLLLLVAPVVAINRGGGGGALCQ